MIITRKSSKTANAALEISMWEERDAIKGRFEEDSPKIKQR